MKFHWLEHGPYPCNIGFATSGAALKRELRKHKLPIIEGEWCSKGGAKTWAITQAPWVPFYIICIDIRRQAWAKIAAQLAHEAVHVAQFLWEQIGEDQPGDEAEAYLIEWLVEQALTLVDLPSPSRELPNPH